ncbi:MAG TPA: Gfo/Idh/MocA family oxidoreductase [Planctomycetes bacterium]|nr:Gfo/Idh/MocA family oxidoreductase [Planctomycetota bacterium]
MSRPAIGTSSPPLDVVIVGGGMITHDQILPSIYHLQRLGRIGSIKISALNSAPLRALTESQRIRDAFPGQSFLPFPPLEAPPEKMHPEMYRQVIASLDPHNLVVVAVPDHLHDTVIRAALESDQHVLAVKPLVPTYAQAETINHMAQQRGLLVAVEYHKRFDRRALDARLQYREGRFGQFRCGEARMIEPYYYRHSNFQNWFTKENSDPFTYVGCHYVDLVYFITGLRPVEVSVRGVEGTFPNGNVGYMWSAGTVVWENGALLTILDGLGYPDLGAGTNDQGLTLYCEGDDCGAVLEHDDQYRGVSHGYVDMQAGAAFRYVSPDYFRLVPWEGEGLKPVGYGYDSIEAIVAAAARVNAAAQGLGDADTLAARQKVLSDIDQRGLLATPANSWINELVTEAARMSIGRAGHPVVIDYTGTPSVRLR